MGPEAYYSSCGIPSSSLEKLRNILIFSLPHENISEYDRQRAGQINKLEAGSRPSSATKEDREARLKFFKERQNEERQRKLEDMKAQAVAAQKFKEQKEQERRLRLEEFKTKEDERRQLVEERKRAINDAEKDRLESILKRNQEREVRHETRRKNERSSLVFAFGSSTPRVLGPSEGVVSSFWGHRRAASTHNITYSAPPLTRRQSERELDGSKKRATSAGGFVSSEVSTPQHAAGCISGYAGRRRTDLMPTVPTKESLSTTPRKSILRSPGRAYSMSRLDQLAKPRKLSNELPALAESVNVSSSKPLSLPKQSSVSRSMIHLAIGKLRPLQPQKPLHKADSRSMHQLSTVAPIPPPRTTRATELRQRKLGSTATSNVEAPSRPGSALSQQSTSSVTSSVVLRSKPTATPRRQRPRSIAVTGVTQDLKNGVESKKTENKPPLPKSRKPNLGRSQEKITKRKSITPPTDDLHKTIELPKQLSGNTEDASAATQIENLQDIRTKEVVNSIVDNNVNASENEPTLIEKQIKETEVKDNIVEKAQPIDFDQSSPALIEDNKVTELHRNEIDISLVKNTVTHEETVNLVTAESNDSENTSNSPLAMESQINDDQGNELDMSASINLKPRISTEEEAKAALAERRRIAREEAERQAELERLRIEEEQRLEIERQQREEELQRQLIEQQRAAEEERLNEAIRETQRREEEERTRREEEQKLKVVKEEAELKAKEEYERQKAELQERLRNEEKEREARRKRVEAIMLRTRGKNNSGIGLQTEEKNAENKMNGSKADIAENGHKNEKDLETVDNIISVDSLKNANSVTTNNTISTDDNLNSNNTWQRNSQTDLLM